MEVCVCVNNLTKEELTSLKESPKTKSSKQKKRRDFRTALEMRYFKMRLKLCEREHGYWCFSQKVVQLRQTLLFVKPQAHWGLMASKLSLPSPREPSQEASSSCLNLCLLQTRSRFRLSQWNIIFEKGKKKTDTFGHCFQMLDGHIFPHTVFLGLQAPRPCLLTGARRTGTGSTTRSSCQPGSTMWRPDLLGRFTRLEPRW